jgi:CheY-like chemotaxis protein
MQRDNSGHQHNTLTMKQKQIQKENTTLKRVLIVTAESDVNLALKVALEQVEGAHYYFKVDCFDNPVLALKNFEDSHYDLFLVDVIMPQMNGFELAEEIKRIDKNIKMGFLIAGEVPGKLRANQLGAEEHKDKFIQLPIENNNFLSLISTAIDS